MDVRLTKAIDEIVNEKTFTVEAVDAIKNLRDRAEILERNLEAAEKKGDLQDKVITDLNKSVDIFKTREAELTKREREVTEREKNMITLEKTTAVAEAKAGVWDECLKRLLGNRILRENFNKSIPVPVAPGQNMQGFVGSGSEIGQNTTEEA